MSTIRWQKALKDLLHNKSRTALVILSIAVGVMAFGSIVDARETVNRDLTASHQAARPESVTLYTIPFTDSLVRSVTRLPEVEAAAQPPTTPGTQRAGTAGGVHWRYGRTGTAGWPAAFRAGGRAGTR